MAYFQVVIHEIVSRVVAIEADTPEAANTAAMELLVNSNDPNEFFDCVIDRAFVATVETDEKGAVV